MISFATLFLGLVLGTHPCAVTVGEGVASVEIHLDGALLARLQAPPWQTECDFGTELLPHFLLAIAYDEVGLELERSEQWVNVARPAAEVSLTLDLQPDGIGSRVRANWESIEGEPIGAEVVFDGVAIAVEDPRLVELPAYNPSQLHFVRFELDFDKNLSAFSETTFGGLYTDEVDTRLTALAVSLEGKYEPALEQMAASFELRGQPIPVVAIEKGPAEVIVVRDINARESLRSLIGRPNPYGRSSYRPTSLRKDQRIRLLGTMPIFRGEIGAQYQLFPTSADLEVSNGEFSNYLARAFWQEVDPERQRLVEATAVGGLMASERNRRRAVVVVLGERRDHSADMSPAQVRGYLQALGVPLLVWSTEPESWGDAAQVWGEIADISDSGKLAREVRHLRRLLEQQRIVWFRGIHLPQEILLRGAAVGLRRAW